MEGDMFPESSDPKLRRLMECSFGAACLEIDVASMLEYGKAAETMMALRIMTTVAAGERDPGRLKDLALQAVDGRRIDEPPSQQKATTEMIGPLAA
jgi:hypothetical protein